MTITTMYMTKNDDYKMSGVRCVVRQWRGGVLTHSVSCCTVQEGNDLFVRLRIMNEVDPWTQPTN